MKVALVYDRVNKWGGAERILLALHKIFPDAPLYTSVYNPKKASWADTFVVTSFLKNVPHELFAALMPISFETFSFDVYDLVISVTSEAAKGIITKPHTKHLCICLTPTRYLWSGYDEYFKQYPLRVITKPLIWYLRTWDQIASSRPDQVIAISEEVKRRIKKYYNRDAHVIYPPIMISHVKREKKKGEYFLVVSRLSRFTTYKRVDLAVAAATKLSLPLKVIGDGDKTYFKKNAGPTVEFVGKVSDEKLTEYYQHAKALIFPGIEDFGLVMAEAQSFGVPVIAFRGGGALEIIKEGETGIFFEKQDIASLIHALENFDESHYNSEVCMQNAQQFSLNKFQKGILEATHLL